MTLLLDAARLLLVVAVFGTFLCLLAVLADFSLDEETNETDGNPPASAATEGTGGRTQGGRPRRRSSS
jgi:hypothetical protein